MNHSMDFSIEYEVLGKSKKKKVVTTQLTANNVLLEKYDIRGMKLGTVEVPFKSFVRNFGVILARALHGTTGWTAGIKTASGASAASPVVMTATEGAITTIRSKSGIFIGDNNLNSVAAASVGTTLSYIDGKNFIQSPGGRTTVGKSDYFLGRRIEANTTTASSPTGVDYGANSITILDNNTIQIKRRFFQYRGVTPIKVAEFGLGTYKGSGGLAGTILLARDTFSTAIELGYEQYLDVTYSFTLPSNQELNTNFICMLANLFSNSNAYSVVLTSGAVNTAPGFHTAVDFKAAADAEYGIVVGYQDGKITAPYYNSYKLENPILNAVLDKGAVTFINELDTYSDTTRFGFYRDFTNVDTSQVSVNEIGLYTKISATYCMIARSTLPTNVNIDVGDVLRVKVYFNFPVASTVEPALET